MSSHDVERAYVAAMLDNAGDRLDQARSEMRAELDHLRESWSSGVAQQLQAHEDHVAQMRDDQAAWFKSLYNDEPAPTDVAQQESHDSSGRGPATPAGVPAGQPDPHAAEMALARSISAMSMQEYAERRAELGVQSPTSMSRLSGH